MPMDAPESARAQQRRAALLLAPVLLIALGVPYALHLPARAAAVVVVAVLAAALFAANAMRRVLQADASPDCERLLLDLADTLPQGVLVIADGRPRDANPAARAMLGVGDGDIATHDPGDWFDDAAFAARVAGAAQIDREDTVLRRPDGTQLLARVTARDTLMDARPLRLVLFADLSDDRALAARLDAQRTELETLARRLMTLQEDERAALSRELHDDIGQAITAIKLCASSLAHEPDPPRRTVVQETAHEIAAIADQTVAKLRDLSLLLRPPQLDALGLEAALRWQAGVLFRSEFPRIEFDIPMLDCRPPRDVELACFRIAQEALTNVLRHARAGRVLLQLACDDRELRLVIEDDGCGMPDDRTTGLGLITMRERAALIGGRVDIDSRPGRTHVEAVLPLPAAMDARVGVLQG